MKLSPNYRSTINFSIIGISLLFWIVLIFNPGQILGMKHCHVSTSGLSMVSFQMLLEMNPITAQLLGWGLMVIAMMLPKLIMPIQFIYSQSLKRYRFFNALLFVLGYTAIWIVVGFVMIGIIFFTNLWMPMSLMPALLVVNIAIVWQYSPIKQRFLNLGHEHRVLSVFGLKSMQDSLYMGFTHGISCVGAGWALMLFPMLLPYGHNLAMIIVTFIMIAEHLEHPRVPEWGFNPRLKLIKVIIAQTKIKLLP